MNAALFTIFTLFAIAVLWPFVGGTLLVIAEKFHLPPIGECKVAEHDKQFFAMIGFIGLLVLPPLWCVCFAWKAAKKLAPTNDFYYELPRKLINQKIPNLFTSSATDPEQIEKKIKRLEKKKERLSK